MSDDQHLPEPGKPDETEGRPAPETTGETPGEPTEVPAWKVPYRDDPFGTRRTLWQRVTDTLSNWWRCFWQWLRGAEPRGEPEFPLPAPVLLHEDPKEFTFPTPAYGDAYDFEISVRLDWCSRAMATGRKNRADKEEELRELVAEHRADAKERITNLIRPKARKFPPFEPALLEAELRDEGVCVELNEGEIQVHARVRVAACDEVREAMRPGWLDRLRLDSFRQSQEQQIRQMRDLRARWAELLYEALADMGEIDVARTGWLKPYPLALAEKPTDAYKFLIEMFNQRQENSQALLGKLGQAIRTSHELDVWDVMARQDSALRAVLKDLGVPVSDLRGDALLSPDE